MSPITSDARVLRQIGILSEFGDVTTIGFGSKPPNAVDHIEVPRDLKTLPQTLPGVINLLLRRMKASELAAPAVAFAARALHGRRFDLVVANEARVLALADAVAGDAPVWADMHEWAPEERTHILSWRLLVAPFMVHLCRSYLPRAAAITAVCNSIADLYRQEFAVSVEVMRNAGPFQQLEPTPLLPGRIRLVHSGTAIHGRALETMIDVVKGLDAHYTLDLYLMPGGDGGRYLASLRERASDCARIAFRDPVPPTDLPRVLNEFDVGVFWIPPTHTNARYALPNKFFDFVQARLAIAVGPSVEMANLVTRHALGAVSSGFTVEECRASLESLSRSDILEAKQSSHTAARTLSFEADAGVARRLLTGLLSRSAGGS